MKDKRKQKPRGMKHRVREEKEREQRIALAITLAILVVLILVSAFFIHSMLGPSPQEQETSFASKPKAAIVDNIGLTAPNQTFIQAATNTLEQAGYIVDYYPGEQVTVEFYRNIPTCGYRLIILRVHSSASAIETHHNDHNHHHHKVATPVVLFTSEPYNMTKYVDEQSTDQILKVSYNGTEPPYYFAIAPKFVLSSLDGQFKNTIIISMGNESLIANNMAQAFVERGAKVYLGWSGPVLTSHADLTTTHLLQHFVIEKRTLIESVTETFIEVGADPVHKSVMLYHPLEAGDFAHT